MQVAQMVNEARDRELLYYYNGLGSEISASVVDRFKTLLLFFDGFAAGVLTPPRLEDANSELFGPLRDMGMILDIEDETLIKDGGPLIGAVVDVLSLSDIEVSRLVGAIELDQPDFLDSGPGKRSATLRLLLVLLDALAMMYYNDLIAPSQKTDGVHLELISNMPRYARTLLEIVTKARQVDAASIVEMDLSIVTFDLASVPLDEILDFRRIHGSEFRKYRRLLRKTLIEISYLSRDHADETLRDRREELNDLKAELLRTTKLSFRLKEMIPFGLGITGAAVTGFGHDYLGAAGGALGALSSLSQHHDSGAYSYLFAAAEEWKGR